MVRKEVTAALIALIEKGNLTAPGSEDILCQMPGETWANIIHANRGSLDAAKALHDAVLPMWDATILVGQGGNPSRAIVRPYTPQSGNPSSVTEWNADPARAWLLAQLRALHAQEPEPTENA
jgi:hypothetical protein